MAKKKEAFTFGDLNTELKKINTNISTMAEGSTSAITEWIHTGNYLLNACMGGSLFKGIAGNRITELAGESGVGKTFLALNIAKNAQAQGYNIYYFDSENAIDRALIDKFGIDPARIVHAPVGTGHDVTNQLTNITNTMLEAKKNSQEIPKILFILDSMGNLSTVKERADSLSGSEKADMTRAKELKRLFRVITADLGKLNMPFIFTNHTYKDVSAFFPTDIPSGGTGPTYNASVVLILSKAKLKDGTEQSGIIVTAKPMKNRFAKPEKIKFHIHFNTGMNPYVGLEEYISWENCGIQKGKIEKGVFVPNENGRSMAVEHLGTHVPMTELFTPKVFTKEVLERLEPLIAQKFAYSSSVEQDDLELMFEVDDQA